MLQKESGGNIIDFGTIQEALRLQRSIGECNHVAFPILRSQLLSEPLAIRLIPRKDVNARALVQRELKEKEFTSTYIEAEIYLLNSYATDDIFGNPTLEIVSLKKLPSHTAVQFAKSFSYKAL